MVSFSNTSDKFGDVDVGDGVFCGGVFGEDGCCDVMLVGDDGVFDVGGGVCGGDELADGTENENENCEEVLSGDDGLLDVGDVEREECSGDTLRFQYWLGVVSL